MTKKTSNGSPNPACKHGIRGTTSVIVASNIENFAAGLYARTLALNQQMVEAAALRELRA